MGPKAKAVLVTHMTNTKSTRSISNVQPWGRLATALKVPRCPYNSQGLTKTRPKKTVKTCLFDEFGFLLSGLQRPPQSPDLDPMELFWDVVKWDIIF